MWKHTALVRAALPAASGLSFLLALGPPGRASAAVDTAGGAPSGPSPRAISPDCPVASDQVSASGGLAVCVDRGEGATYLAGDRITVCVTANIPAIAIFPPPPAPTIRVESAPSDRSIRRLMEDEFFTGQRCLTGTIVAPFGYEVVRAQAVRQDGTAFLEDTVTFTTRPR
jgi:hypothetical protein